MTYFLSRRPRGNALDYRTRRSRTQRRTEGFAHQMSAIVDTYMTWMLEMGDNAFTETYVPPQAVAQGTYKIKVLDMFRESSSSFIIVGLTYCREFFNNHRTYRG